MRASGAAILMIYLMFFCNSFTIESQNISSDSLIKIAKKVHNNDPSKALEYSKKAIIKSKEEGSDFNLGRAYEILGISFDYLGELDSALIYFDKSIELLKREKDQSFIARVYTSKANSLFLLNKNKEALTYYSKSNELFKTLNNKKEEASSLMGIGNVYSNMKSYDLCLKYYNQALDYFIESNDSIYISYVLTNISEVYEAMNIKDKELEFQRKSLSIKEKLKDDYGLVYSYTNMSRLLLNTNKDSALYFANKAIETSLKINNQEFLSSAYEALGNVHYHTGQYLNAIQDYMQALTIARKLKNTKNESAVLKLLAEAQIKAGDFQAASNSLLQFISVNDSVNSLEMQKSFSELQTQYETVKKEKEISLLNERDKKRQFVIYSTFIVVALLGILSFVLYNRFRLKRKSAVELGLRNEEIQKQKHLVDEKQKEILDSINYAKRIQFALLANEEMLRDNIPQHFVYFKPKDIVSGDFYWATKKDEDFYLAVCDSTGHGVPGAFMSLLNISFLNEAIIEKDIKSPNDVLSYVREKITNSIDGGKDGMDAILIRISNTNRNIIEYASANNAPILISDHKIIELPKDKMPVGKGERIEPFKLHTVEIKGGDYLYLYTDGYADQFGGKDGKKFKYKQLNEFLLSVRSEPLGDQLQKLDDTFENWRGNLEQVDDVCVIGIRF